MDIESLKESLQTLSDTDLFKILDVVSEEVKRRNQLISPPISDIRNKPVEQNVKDFLTCLADLGIAVKTQK